MTEKHDVQNIWRRLWIYQKECSPVFAHGPLILAFSFCAASFSARLRIQSWPEWQSVCVAFITCFIFFLQLRIADEFKDAEEDARWRPYRAVPRGLISLKELAVVFVIGAVIQLAVALWWSVTLTVILIFAWAYFAAMSVEFGAREWLKARPITYLWTHMLIMPIVDFFATATDWVQVGYLPPPGLTFFLIASFCNGIVIEFGRKIRTQEQEEEGVETYSRLWGPKKASVLWWLFVVATAINAVIAAKVVGTFLPVFVVLSLLAMFLGVYVLLFTRKLGGDQAKKFEVFSAVWTLCLYLSLGILPGVFS